MSAMPTNMHHLVHFRFNHLNVHVYLSLHPSSLLLSDNNELVRALEDLRDKREILNKAVSNSM